MDFRQVVLWGNRLYSRRLNMALDHPSRKEAWGRLAALAQAEFVMALAIANVEFDKRIIQRENPAQ